MPAADGEVGSPSFEARAVLAALADRAELGLFAWSPEGGIRWANAPWLRILGYDARHLEAGGLSWERLCPAGHPLPGMGPRTEASRGARSDVPTARRLVRRDGQDVPVLLGATDLGAAGGAGFVVVASGWENVLREQALAAEHAERLRHAHEELRAYTFTLAHDLKSPLRGIQLLTEWIHEELAAPTERATRFLGELRERAQRLMLLIEGTLDGGRNRGPGQELVDVDELARTAYALLVTASSRARLETSNLPRVCTYRFALEQVLLNLIGNALHHAKGEQIVVRVSAQPSRDGFLEIRVADDGEPADVATQEDLAAALAGRPAPFVGGLGLAIVHRIVTRRGGRAWLSTSERGTAVCFTWPVETGHGHAQGSL